VVYDIIHQILTGRDEHGCNRELIVSLFRDAKVMHRIVEGQKQNDIERQVFVFPSSGLGHNRESLVQNQKACGWDTWVI